MGSYFFRKKFAVIFVQIFDFKKIILWFEAIKNASLRIEHGQVVENLLLKKISSQSLKFHHFWKIGNSCKKKKNSVGNKSFWINNFCMLTFFKQKITFLLSEDMINNNIAISKSIIMIQKAV